MCTHSRLNSDIAGNAWGRFMIGLVGGILVVPVCVSAAASSATAESTWGLWPLGRPETQLAVEARPALRPPPCAVLSASTPFEVFESRHPLEPIRRPNRGPLDKREPAAVLGDQTDLRPSSEQVPHRHGHRDHAVGVVRESERA